jgi:hypothetical protein
MVDANNVAWHIVKGFLRLFVFFEKIEHIQAFYPYLQTTEKCQNHGPAPSVLITVMKLLELLNRRADTQFACPAIHRYAMAM